MINCYTCSATTDVVSTNMFGMMDASIHNLLFVCSSSSVFTVVPSERPHVVTDLNDNDNDNDTLREVPHLSNEGLALQARVSGPWPHKKESVLLV